MKAEADGATGKPWQRDYWCSYSAYSQHLEADFTTRAQEMAREEAASNSATNLTFSPVQTSTTQPDGRRVLDLQTMNDFISSRSLSGFRKPDTAKAVGESIVAFPSHVTSQAKDDVMYSTLFAQLVANAHASPDDPQKWYEEYAYALESIDWVKKEYKFSQHKDKTQEFTISKVVLDAGLATATEQEGKLLQAVLESLAKSFNEPVLNFFENLSTRNNNEHFQIGICDVTSDGDPTLAVVSSFFSATKDHGSAWLFYKWTADEIDLWIADQKMILNSKAYAQIRELIKTKLGQAISNYIRDVSIVL